MPFRHYSIGHIIIFSSFQLSRLHYNIFDVFLYFCICLCLLCTVVYMHNFHSANIFIACNSVIYTKSFNVLAIFYNGPIV